MNRCAFIDYPEFGSHFPHYPHFGGKNAESAENAGVRSKFGINAMTDFLKVNPGKSPDKILECAFRHGVG